MKKLAVSLAVCAAMLVACSNKPDGSEFIGTWYDPGKGEKIQITKNGENFLLHELGSDKNPNPSKAVLSGVYRDGLLKLMVGGRTLVLTHVQADDTLILPLMNGQGTETLGRVKD
ncbi:hypothetical protein [Ralstonia sp. SET104]|uniref:hypothetical protein n=1 Tax=Ralstonia sp. SET104 TaxID=2448774 RepID=UPI000F55D92E|nr:hypothetical protein [Ralstonia sp. SET104]GCB06725.1 hypothetical protein PSUB009319_43560 [Ralstonia sp. SET104]